MEYTTDMQKETSPAFLELDEVVKRFPGTLAVDRVNFSAHRGHVHGIVGENGAGKSTLIRVIAGVYRPDEGTIRVDGVERSFHDYADARRAGVGVVYQNLSLLPELSAAENVIMGIWPRNRFGLINWSRAYNSAQESFKRVGLPINPRTLVSALPMAERQLVEIAKVLSQNPEIVIFDEPTAPLSRTEVDRLFQIINSLREQGKLVLFVSHRLDEVLGICDTITVMKDGRHVVTAPVGEFDENKLIAAMVGREITEVFPAKAAPSDKAEPILSVSGVLDAEGERRIELVVHKGEVLGVGGLQGQGQLDFLHAIFGVHPIRGLHLTIEGTEHLIRSPGDAMRAGIALIPENRIEEGVFAGLSVGLNSISATIDRRTRFGFVNRRAEAEDIRWAVERLAVRLTSPNQNIESLSGGNMQKVVVAKWLLTKPKVIIALEPTQGVDVGTKQQMYVLFRRLADEGIAVIVFTSDMLELIGLCDRVVVMNRGVITGNLRGEEMREEAIMAAAVARSALSAEAIS